MVTDPEESVDQLQRRQVTFVLGHDSHGHAEQTRHGLHRLPADDRVRRHRTAATCSASSARPYTDKGGSGGQAPPLSPARAGPTSARSTRRSSSSSTSPARRRRPTPTRPGSTVPVHRSGIAPGRLAAAQRSDQPVPDRLGRVPLRGRRGRSRTAGSPLAAIDMRQDSITGPVIATANLTSTGGTGVWATQTVAAHQRRERRARAVRDVPHGHGRRDRRQPVQPQLGRVRRQRRHGPVESSTPGDAGGTVPATLALSARHAGDVRAVHAGRREDVHAHRRRPTSSRPPVTRR